MPQHLGYPVDVLTSRGDADHEVVHGVVRHLCDADPVDLQERSRRQPAQSFVDIDKGVVLDDRLQERRCLRPDVGIGVLAERRRLRAGCGGTKQSDVAGRWRVAEEAGSEVDEILQVEVLDRLAHFPRCSRASAWAAFTRSAAASTRSRCSPLATYSRTARRAASCMEMPSRSARSRNATCSSFVSRSVIAITPHGIGMIPAPRPGSTAPYPR